MTLQDLAVVKEHNVDVKIAIINNNHLGMIRNGRPSSTTVVS